MTVLQQRRCRHCADLYEYQASGPGAGVFNHDRYCPECWEAIRDLLDHIDVKYRQEWVPVESPTAQELCALREEREAPIKAKGGLVVRQIAAPLFDLEDPTNENIAGYTTVNGIEYHWSYWTKRGESKVEKLMSRNVITGELTPWVRTRDS